MFPSFFQILLSSFSFISHFIPFNTFSLIFTILHIHFILINIILFTFYHSKSKHSYLNHHSQQSLFNQLYQSFHFTLSFILLNYLHHHWVAVCVRDESICWSQFTIHSISISSHSTLWYDQTQSLITISFTILQISLFFSLINLSIIHHLHSFFFCCVFEMIEEMSRIQIRFVNNRLNPIEQSWIEWEYKCGNTSQSHKGRINELTLIETMCVKRSKCLIINNELIRIWYNDYDFIHYLQINWFFKILKEDCLLWIRFFLFCTLDFMILWSYWSKCHLFFSFLYQFLYPLFYYHSTMNNDNDSTEQLLHTSRFWIIIIHLACVQLTTEWYYLPNQVSVKDNSRSKWRVWIQSFENGNREWIGWSVWTERELDPWVEWGRSVERRSSWI